MTVSEVGQFRYRNHDVVITQETTDDTTTLFKVKANTEEVTMEGAWNPATRCFTRHRYYSNKAQEIGRRIEKRPGHIPYLGAEGLGHLLLTGIIDEYWSSDVENRTRGTNKTLVYLQTGKWEKALRRIDGPGGRTIGFRRRI
ncbi:MAG: hypothetical protein KGJ07_01390 [Patescibacteria group bacterium]|nr:hypothetical protein [Patescibacteria group bacterium]MDE2590226.1 hypothetical protein [Patescibacteria group bacterium]